MRKEQIRLLHYREGREMVAPSENVDAPPFSARVLWRRLVWRVMVILEMDGDSGALLTSAADLEARRPTSAVTARVVAPMDGGVVVCTVWESAAARDAYQSEPEHQEALQASGLLAAVTGMRSRVFENAELSMP